MKEILEPFKNGSLFKIYLKMKFLPHRKQTAPLYKDQSVEAVYENDRHILNEAHTCKNTMVTGRYL
jgi:hypothetical protein